MFVFNDNGYYNVCFSPSINIFLRLPILQYLVQYRGVTYCKFIILFSNLCQLNSVLMAYKIDKNNALPCFGIKHNAVDGCKFKHFDVVTRHNVWNIEL